MYPLEWLGQEINVFTTQGIQFRVASKGDRRHLLSKRQGFNGRSQLSDWFQCRRAEFSLVQMTLREPHWLFTDPSLLLLSSYIPAPLQVSGKGNPTKSLVRTPIAIALGAIETSNLPSNYKVMISTG